MLSLIINKIYHLQLKKKERKKEKVDAAMGMSRQKKQLHGNKVYFLRVHLFYFILVKRVRLSI